MAGYIGSKAVNLSTTGADINGDANINGDLSFRDNDKIKLGAGSDLQIYHDGSNSYISDQGAGDLLIRSSNDLWLQNADGTETYARFDEGASTYISYAGSTKLTTTSTGVDITGTLTSDGLTVGNATSQNSLFDSVFGSGDANEGIVIVPSATGKGWVGFNNGNNANIPAQFTYNFSSSLMELYSSGSLNIQTGAASRLNISSGGDISFFEDTGTTPKFFWDASAESLGIGTSSPSTTLDVNLSQTLTSLTSPAQAALRLQNTNGAANNYFTALSFTTSTTGVGTDSAIVSYSESAGNSALAFYTDGSNVINERMRIASDGNLLVGKTSTSRTTTGCELRPQGFIRATEASDKSLELVRTGSDGEVQEFFSDSTLSGVLGVAGNDLAIGTGDTGLRFVDASDSIQPINMTNFNRRDNAIDLGNGTYRFDDIYATNGSIQTSDQNEKQQIASLTDAEMTAAKAISKLFKTFKWNDSVAEKGDAARTHTGIIAQEVEQAMTDAGLSANNYAFFISTTWWETQTEVPAIEAVAEVTETTTDEDGNEVVTVVTEAVEARDAYTRTDTYETAEEAPEGATERNRKGIRYTELLSFIGAATEQRLASIELRLAALEAE